MKMFWLSFFSGGVVLVAEVIMALLVHRLGRFGRAISDAACRAPLLDVVVALLTWIPWLVAGLLLGWLGVFGAALGQAVAVVLWAMAHEFWHEDAAAGPRIVKAHRKMIGRIRNHTALWVTAVALPVFLLVRFAQILLYPLLQWLLRFPPYRHSEWINVSRQKFDGLVGHDLIWCIYCDWMTGVYALGGEMLRNVESFWCPIRFGNAAKCEKCRIDFPDVDAWVPADGTMADVEALVVEKYGDGRREWFGHPARLTVEGGERE